VVAALGINGYAFALSVENGLLAIEIAAAAVGRKVDVSLNWSRTATITTMVLNPFSAWEPAQYVFSTRSAIQALKNGQPQQAWRAIDDLLKDLKDDLGDAIVIKG